MNSKEEPTLKGEADFIDLEFFLYENHSDGDSSMGAAIDAGETGEALGEVLYNEAMLGDNEKYNNNGLIILIDSSKNSAISSLLQCFMGLKTMKDYFLNTKYQKIGTGIKYKKRELS